MNSYSVLAPHRLKHKSTERHKLRRHFGKAITYHAYVTKFYRAKKGGKRVRRAKASRLKVSFLHISSEGAAVDSLRQYIGGRMGGRAGGLDSRQAAHCRSSRPLLLGRLKHLGLQEHSGGE
jgi:hypothetical protein